MGLRLGVGNIIHKYRGEHSGSENECWFSNNQYPAQSSITADC